MWNPCDAVTIMVFLIGLSLRLRTSTRDIGRVLYCVDSIYWYLRILNILGVNKYLGKSIIVNVNTTTIHHNNLFRSLSHYDGQNGKKHDLLRSPFTCSPYEFWSMQTSNPRTRK